jgi:hypothetical protein
VAVPALYQRGHSVAAAEGEKLFLQKVIIFKTVIAAGRVKYPVAHIYQIEKPPKLLFAQFNVHTSASL